MGQRADSRLRAQRNQPEARGKTRSASRKRESRKNRSVKESSRFSVPSSCAEGIQHSIQYAGNFSGLFQKLVGGRFAQIVEVTCNQQLSFDFNQRTSGMAQKILKFQFGEARLPLCNIARD